MRAVMFAGVSAIAGCGADATEVSDDAPEEPALAEAVSEPVDVFVRDAAVEGPLESVLSVDPLPAGVLRPGERMFALVSFTVTEDTEIPELPFHTGTAPAASGSGVLGHSGICGYGWDERGARRTEDPCSAAEPVRSLSPGNPLAIGILMYPATDEGRAAVGTYTLQVPIDGASTLVLDVELAPHDPTPPRWAAPDATLTVSAEEIAPQTNASVLVEDPYGHEYDTVQLSPPGAVTLDVPAGVWRIGAMVPGTNGTLLRCGSPRSIVIESGEERRLTLTLDLDPGLCSAK